MRQVLIVVDYQNDFVDGTLGFPGAELLEEKIIQKIRAYKSENKDIIFTLDTHEENYLETQEGKNLPVVHCVKGTEGHKLFGELKALEKDGVKTFEKPTFGSLELANYLREKAYDSVELVGLVSNICVISNAILAKAALPEAEIIVDASCTDSFDKELQSKAFDVLEGVQVTVINKK